MGIADGEESRSRQCPCCLRCDDCVDFRKIVYDCDARIAIYCHAIQKMRRYSRGLRCYASCASSLLDIPCHLTGTQQCKQCYLAVDRGKAVVPTPSSMLHKSESSPTSKTLRISHKDMIREQVNVRKEELRADAPSSTEDVFILHTTSKMELSSTDFLPALEPSQISCPRCKMIYEHARKLVLKLPTTIKYHNTIGICDHCQINAQLQKQCDTCENIVKKFLADKDKRKVKNTKEWLSKIHIFLKGSIPQYDLKIDEVTCRTHSDLNIDRSVDVQQRFQTVSKERPKSPLGGYRSDSDVPGVFPYAIRHRVNEPSNEKTHQQYKTDSLKPRQVLYRDNDIRQEFRISEKPSQFQGTPEVYDLMSSTRIEKKEAPKVKYIVKIKPNEINIGPRQISKPHHMPSTIPTIKQKAHMSVTQIKKYPSYETLLSSLSKFKRDSIDKQMSYFFPTTMDERESTKRAVSSSELIHDTREMLRLRDEEKLRKEIEDSRMREEKRKYTEEKSQEAAQMKRAAKEEKKIAKEEAKKKQFEIDQMERAALEVKSMLEKDDFNKIKNYEDKLTDKDDKYKKKGLMREDKTLREIKDSDKKQHKESLSRIPSKKLATSPKAKDKEKNMTIPQNLIQGKELGHEKKSLDKITKIIDKNMKSKDKSEADAQDSVKKITQLKAKEAKEKGTRLKSNEVKNAQLEDKESKDADLKKSDVKDTQVKDTGKIDDQVNTDQSTAQPMNADIIKMYSTKAGPEKKEMPAIVKTLTMTVKKDVWPKETSNDGQKSKNVKESKEKSKEREGESTPTDEKKDKDKGIQKESDKMESKGMKIKQELPIKNKDDPKDQSKKGPLEQKPKEDTAILELQKLLSQQAKDSEKENKIKKIQETEEKKAREAAEKKVKETTEMKLKQKQDTGPHKEKIVEQLKKNELTKTENPIAKEINMKDIKIRKPSTDDLILQLVKLKQSSPQERQRIVKNFDPIIIKQHHHHKHRKNAKCLLCLDSDLELDLESVDNIEMLKVKHELNEVIVGDQLLKYVPQQEKKEKLVDLPILFKSAYCDLETAPLTQPLRDEKLADDPAPKASPIGYILPNSKTGQKPPPDPEQTKGIIRYALSDRTFIDKGWTMLPTEKVVRKMNVYRMRPAHPEFDWFEHNKNKKIMHYDSGERLAEFEDSGRGRWYYRNGRLALDYYDAEEINAQQRVVIYSSGEPDERGRTHPVTVLAMFDYLGNGVVFDHGGKIRLKYNQTEGVVLDRGIGPISHWKWHTLNDPPVLQQVMIDTQMAHKDPDIVKLGPADAKTRPDNEDMLAIEFDNFIKEKSKKLTQSFKPFQIKMKALKINENFSLRVLDQATVYLIYRDGTTNLKLNIGMILDHKEIVDTDTAELGEVSNSLERFPARTDSLAGLQRSVAYVQRYERNRTDRERKLRPPEPSASADQLTAAASRPMRPPFRTLPTATTSNGGSACGCSRRPPTCNVYYNSRLC